MESLRELNSIQDAVYTLFSCNIIHESIFNLIEETARNYAFNNLKIDSLRAEFDRSDYDDIDEFFTDNYGAGLVDIISEFDDTETEKFTEAYKQITAIALNNSSIFNIDILAELQL